MSGKSDDILKEERAVIERYAAQVRLLEGLLSSITDFAYTFDLEGRFTFINKALLDLWGMKLVEAVGKNFFDLKYPEALAEKLQRQIREVIQTKRVLVDETPYTSLTGAGGYYQYIFSPVLGANGEVEAVAGTTRDITAHKNAEVAERAARAEAESANRAKDKFLAVLSHELRTPLSPVVMTIPAMELDADMPLKFRDDLAMVRRNIDLEVKLIDDLLDLSRITSGKLRLQMQGVRVHEVLGHAIHNSMSDAAGKRLDVVQELRAGDDSVTADPARLQQVFWNLLRNAVKFTPERGRIVVRTWNEGGGLMVEVRDTGVGIEAGVLPKVFDAFEQGEARMTRQFGGLGLGLAIAKAVVEMHGGKIEAASEGKDRGAAFTIRLMTAVERGKGRVEGDGPRRMEEGACARSRVLLVEDHEDTARTMARLLVRSGFDVKTAGSVAAALELAGGEVFDVVVSDIGLPDATGYELMEEIKRRYGIKGIALSGYGMEEDMRRSREAGFVDHVVKPVDVGRLAAVIQRVIGEKTQG
ncbi:MAG TPA: ATP-binding protein [Tepidisphaeraceae bacterium]|jgi:PAS domain S-box-containing protein|nr:ATP-binding protein [Tepidisphaeraceae bacterium]